MRRAVLLLWISMAGAVPAHAFDCAKAAREDEKAICADPALKAADDAMESAYKAVRAKLNTEGIKQLVVSQRIWLAERADCGGDGECLKARIEARTAALSPVPQSGPGGIEIVPFFIAIPGDKTHWQVNVSGFHLHAPQSLSFESYVEQVEEEAKRAPIPADDVTMDGSPYTFEQTLTATYASPRFLSVASSFYEYSGGAHGNYGQSFRHFDLSKDETASYSDIFADGAEAKIIPECLRLLALSRKEKLGEDMPADDGVWDVRESVVKKVGDLSGWTFSADSAAMYFPPYEIGSYAEGEYECRMPVSFLKPLLKPGNPWVAP